MYNEIIDHDRTSWLTFRSGLVSLAHPVPHDLDYMDKRTG